MAIKYGGLRNNVAKATLYSQVAKERLIEMKAKAWLLVAIVPMFAPAEDDRKTESWLSAISHVLGDAVRPATVVVTPAPQQPVVYVQPVSQPPVVYVQPQPASQPTVVYVRQPPPQPVVAVVTPVYVPEYYVWNGYEYIGWVGNQYVYYSGTVWHPCRPEHIARFHEYSRSHPDWRRRAQRHEHGREPRHEQERETRQQSNPEYQHQRDREPRRDRD